MEIGREVQRFGNGIGNAGRAGGCQGGTGKSGEVRGQENDSFDKCYQAAGEKAAEKETTEKESTEAKSCRQQLLEIMEEMTAKIKSGKIEPEFQIGARAYTKKEWDKLLANFDDAEETIKEEVKAMAEEAKKKAKEEALQAASPSEQTSKPPADEKQAW